MNGQIDGKDSTETSRVTWPGEVVQDLREGAEDSWFFWEMFWVMSTESYSGAGE